MAKKKTTKRKRKKDPAIVVQDIADMVDRRGVLATDLYRSHLLGFTFVRSYFRDIGLDIDKIEETYCFRADRQNVRTMNEILERVKEHNKRIGADCLPEEREFPDLTPKKSVKKLFGQNVTAVIRWMGTDAWDLDEVKKAFQTLDIQVADSTIDTQLRAGKKGQRGDPAKLSETQMETLYQAAE